MAKVYDVPADILVKRLSEILKGEDIPAPDWTQFVKTGTHADKPPQNSDWWHVRCASILRKIYLHGPASVKDLRVMYGGGRPVGYGAADSSSKTELRALELQINKAIKANPSASEAKLESLIKDAINEFAPGGQVLPPI